MNYQKDEFLNILCSILAPQIYSGISSIYSYAVNLNEKLKLENDGTSDIPSILKIFQFCLKKISSWNDNMINDETKSILEKTNSVEFLPDLLHATLKSYIIFMTNNPHSNLITNETFKQVKFNNFIHRCYMEAGDNFYNKPDLFWHGYKTLQIKKNQNDALDIINISITDAVRKTVQMREIVKEYLKYKPLLHETSTHEHQTHRSVTNNDETKNKSFIKLDDVVIHKNENHFSPMEQNSKHVGDDIEDKINKLTQVIEQFGGELNETNKFKPSHNQEHIIEEYSNSSDNTIKSSNNSKKSTKSTKSKNSKKSKSSEKLTSSEKENNDLLKFIPPKTPEKKENNELNINSSVASETKKILETEEISETEETSEIDTNENSMVKSNYFAKYTANK